MILVITAWPIVIAGLLLSFCVGTYYKFKEIKSNKNDQTID